MEENQHRWNEQMHGQQPCHKGSCYVGMEGLGRSWALLSMVSNLVRWKICETRKLVGVECCGVVAPRAERCHGTFNADVVDGREDIGRSWDTMLCSFDQWQQNGSSVDRGVGWDMVGSADELAHSMVLRMM